MACSAVVTELPNGVFMTITPRAVAAGTSTLSTPIPARPMTLSRMAALQDIGGHLGRRPDRQAVVTADDRRELLRILLEVGLKSTSTPRIEKICAAAAESRSEINTFGRMGRPFCSHWGNVAEVCR